MTRRLLLAGAAAVAALVAGFWFLALAPASSHLSAAHQALAAAQDKRGALSAQLGSLQAEKRELPAMRAELARFQSAVPTSPSLAAAIDDLTNDMKASGVAIPTITPGSATPAGATTAASKGPQSISMTMTVNGTYAQITEFLDLLNASPRTFSVISLSITPGAGTASMSASVGSEMFYNAA